MRQVLFSSRANSSGLVATKAGSKPTTSCPTRLKKGILLMPLQLRLDLDDIAPLGHLSLLADLIACSFLIAPFRSHPYLIIYHFV